MKNSMTVRFFSNDGSYQVNVPSGMTPQNLSKILQNLERTKGASAALWATNFLNTVKNAVIEQVNNYDIKTEYFVLVNIGAATVSVSLFKVAGGRTYLYGKPVFEGTASTLGLWSEASNELRGAVGKLVRFTYRGGSESGVRVVKLDSVTGTGASTLLKGKDVHKDAFRSYRVGNIVGQIEVLN